MKLLDLFLVIMIFALGIIIGFGIRDSYVPITEEWVRGIIKDKDYDWPDHPFDGMDKWVLLEDFEPQKNRKKYYVDEEGYLNCDEGDEIKVEVHSGKLVVLRRKVK